MPTKSVLEFASDLSNIESNMASKKPEELSRGEKTRKDIAFLLKSRHTLLWIVSREEVRVENALVEASCRAKFEIRFWDCATGVVSLPNEDGKRTTFVSDKDPIACLDFIRKNKTRAVYVLRDLHKWINDPLTLRQLRNLAKELETAEPNDARAVIVLSTSSDIPPELVGHTTVLDYPLPDRMEIGLILDNVVAGLPENIAPNALEAGRDLIIDSAVGLTAQEASNCFALSAVVKKTLSPQMISSEKKRIITREKVLTWIDPDPRGLDAIGGLSIMKTWLMQRKLAFSSEAKAYGLPAPKGVIITGVSGGGKSLTAKCIGSTWNMPLLRCDFGALKSKYIGESEANVRKALSVAETVAPCILWVDELEKAMAGSSGSKESDGGVSADALGAVLNWMQERVGSVFVIATANDISVLPPELLRKGRFDEIFFVDLPTKSERKEILIATLRQYNRKPEDIDLDEVVSKTSNFTGAEIAALLPDAMFASFADNQRQLQTKDLLLSASKTVPLATTAKEKLDRLKEWAKIRARRASPEEVEIIGNTRKLDI